MEDLDDEKPELIIPIFPNKIAHRILHNQSWNFLHFSLSLRQFWSWNEELEDRSGDRICITSYIYNPI